MVGRGEPLLRLVPPLRRSLDQVVRHAATWDLANAQVLADGPAGGPTWVVVGDSTAQGVGVEDVADGWVRRVQRLLEERDGHPWRVLNLSRSGAVLSDALETQLPRLAALEQQGWEPALVTAVLGGNDLRRTPLPVLLTRLGLLLHRLPDGAAVASFPRGLREPRARAANLLLTRVASERGLPVIDLWSATGPPWRGKYADGLHPNAAGLTDWVRAVAAALALPPEVDPPQVRLRRRRAGSSADTLAAP